MKASGVSIGIAFSAMAVDVKDRTQSELRNEQIVTKETEKTASNVGYMTTEKSNLVAFNDPVSGELAVVSLNSSTMDKLKAHFGANDFYEREDGITRLDNKAESFVGGWFGDIAYKREFLSADKNQDSRLDSDEYLDTKNGFGFYGEVREERGEKKVTNIIVDNEKYYSTRASNYSIGFKNDDNVTIDKQLNKTLQTDKNFNGNEEFSEFLANKYNKNEDKSAVQLAKDFLGDDLEGFNPFEEGLKIEKRIFKSIHKDMKKEIDTLLSKALDVSISQRAETDATMRDEQSQKIVAIGTLIQNGGDVEKLSKEDQILIKEEIEHSKNSDGNIDIDKLKHIQEYQNAKENYTAPDPKISNLYVEKG